MIGERIKKQREIREMTQSDLARKLGITRSSVNAWEQGISVPSTQYLVEMANLFKVSTDYMLCVGTNETMNLEGLTDADIDLLSKVASHLRNKNKEPNE